MVFHGPHVQQVPPRFGPTVGHVLPGASTEDQRFQAARQWTQSLWKCADNNDICCEECWCPYCHAGHVYQFTKDGTRSLHPGACCGALIADTFGMCGSARCIVITVIRRRLKARYDIDESCCKSCLLSFVCSWCAMCQMHREMHERGDYSGGVGYAPPMRVSEPIAVDPADISRRMRDPRTPIVIQRGQFSSSIYPVYCISGQPQQLPQYGYGDNNATGYPERYEISALGASRAPDPSRSPVHGSLSLLQLNVPEQSAAAPPNAVPQTPLVQHQMV
jgi:Cys-rich protein (TIGR01571 family)